MDPVADTRHLTLATGATVHALVHVGVGDGRPKCLFLHGNPGSLSHFGELMPLLSAFADVVAMDMPGFGLSERSEPAPENLGLDRLAEHAVAVADVLGWRDPFYLVGHSHGGGVAQVAAARWPERVAGLVLLGTLGAPAHASYRLLALPGAETVVRAAAALFGASSWQWVSRAILRQAMSEMFAPEPLRRERLERELRLLARRPEILVAMVHVALGKPCERLLQAAGDIRCPTLFLHGTDDAIVPSSCARAIHDRIVGAGGTSHFELIDGAGHMLMEHQAADVARHVRHHLSAWEAS
ncbi:MAG TPA: alpha/beta hydrolase [Polyangiaceae bacterium]|nr:alpha/beta hydrolase [Polyangiaceae bacterium]